MTGSPHILLLLLAVLVIVAVAARRLRISVSILMVLAGCALALIPGVPEVTLIPELVLLLVLPPLIYFAGVQMSWREFRLNLRPISLLAIGAVAFTACTVAVAAHSVLGLSWPIGFVLGAIVAPPDVIAPLAIARQLGVPRRIVVILEGEGLANDATALVLYRFAVAAVVSGVFSLKTVLFTFTLVVVGELAFGVAIGWLSLHVRRWIDDPRIEITVSLMTPYAAYWLPQYLGGSGVLATIAAGLYVSWNGPLLISAATRVQGVFFWDLTVYVIEGLVFLLTGLQMRTLLERIEAGQVTHLLMATGLVTAVVVVSRIAWMFPATYVPRWLSPSLARRDPAPAWQAPLFLAFVGVRGVVSLAIALALPITINGVDPFPARDLILFTTFGVIVLTLVGQGLLIPKLVDWLGLATSASRERERERTQEKQARSAILAIASRRLHEIAAERHISPEVLQFVQAHHDEREQLIPTDLDETLEISRAGIALRIEAIEEERLALDQLRDEGRIGDEARRRIERELDLEEEILAARAGAHQ